MAAAGWNPGKQTLAVKQADGTWRIPSFREGGEVYIVCLETGSCSCPDHRRRQRECKHLVATKQQAAFCAAAERASRLTDAQLDQWLKFHEAKDNLVVAGAIRTERHRRKADRAPAPASLPSQAELLQIFA